MICEQLEDFQLLVLSTGMERRGKNPCHEDTLGLADELDMEMEQMEMDDNEETVRK